jgi:signal transduction histidine kinase
MRAAGLTGQFAAAIALTAASALLMLLPELTLANVEIGLFIVPFFLCTYLLRLPALLAALSVWLLLIYLLLGRSTLVECGPLLVLLIFGCTALFNMTEDPDKLVRGLLVIAVTSCAGLAGKWLGEGEVTRVALSMVAGWVVSSTIALLAGEVLRLTSYWHRITVWADSTVDAERPTLTQLFEVIVAAALFAATALGIAVAGDAAAPRFVLLELALMVTVLLMAKWAVVKFVAPLNLLATAFEQWRQFGLGETGSGAGLQTAGAQVFSPVDDIYTLQMRFRSLARVVVNSERRLSTIAANYDELLRSLPLGVLAIDADGRVQFLNDSLGEITAHRQDALAQVRSKAAEMLAANTSFDEWQLITEGTPPKHLLLVVTHRLDERGQGSGLWTIVTDITQQKQTSAQLIQASKLATLGEMSTGMAHELNQPLNVISLAVSNLRFSVSHAGGENAKTLAKLERIDEAVKRAASIIDHMRAYGRLSGEGLVDVSLERVVDGVCKLMREQLKLANIRLVNKVDDQSLWVTGNAIQLEQVLINLVTNARDAISDSGGSGEITVDAVINGNSAQLRVTDDGGGIPDDVLPHVFEPFFTTKPVGKGTGLGGSISYGIIRDMQGDIWAENVSKGARITISLPLLQKQPQFASGVLLD